MRTRRIVVATLGKDYSTVKVKHRSNNWHTELEQISSRPQDIGVSFWVDSQGVRNLRKVLEEVEAELVAAEKLEAE